MKLSNVTGISLPLAVWLSVDGYDWNRGDAKAISATSLLKSPRQILLGERLDASNRLEPDVSQFIASRLGHSIHDGIERAWLNHYRKAMDALGYPQQVIERVLINPEPHQIGPDSIPIYLEQRTDRKIMGYTITGKFDMVIEGVIQDFKSTSTFALKGTKDEGYRLQGSIYRWLNPELVTEDHMVINFIFTDWLAYKARIDPSYPQQRVHSHRIELLSLADTETWIRNKLRALEVAADLNEPELPRCTDAELWRSDPSYKFYLDPAKAQDPEARCTKNCDSMAEARAYQATKGGRGVIVTVPGKVKACNYCASFPICSQGQEYDLT